MPQLHAVAEIGPAAIREPPSPLHVDHHAEDGAIAVPGAGRIAARLSSPSKIARPIRIPGLSRDGVLVGAAVGVRRIVNPPIKSGGGIADRP